MANEEGKSYGSKKMDKRKYEKAIEDVWKICAGVFFRRYYEIEVLFTLEFRRKTKGTKFRFLTMKNE
ncbi:hypothetical protein HW555_001540 [Spodoptera exigua]|uniref:Uncharacterized protein n=1 Tax=Spodoptera exigua TaxID=7107 RepID=A0A835LFC4_SPOEX|nr:hypothetical protein HW555_001540 [Spodoptera exigua]